VLAVGPARPELRRCGRLDVVVWPDGGELAPAAAHPTRLVCGPGAVAGIGRLLGARVHVPDGATGDVDTDVDAKAAAALDALDAGEHVVVHVGAADEAAHRGERDAKRAAIEAADARLIAPLAIAARRAGATLAVTSDHGTCPWSGRHDAAPVPFVVCGPPRGPRRLTERAVAGSPITPALRRGAAA
jgi:2,3-bisphosphoglycerate-independent phosphoglycerate mutase